MPNKPQLAHSWPIPRDEAITRLLDWMETYLDHALDAEYWTDYHFAAYRAYTANKRKSYRYFEDTTAEPFKDPDAFDDERDPHTYLRYNRGGYVRLDQIFAAHSDEFHAFYFIRNTVRDDRKIRRVGYGKLRDKLFGDDKMPYISWGIVESVVDQLNTYYDTHGEFPDAYTELVSCPTPNGTLPYAGDSRGDIHSLEYNADKNVVEFTVNAPATDDPDTHHDWAEHTVELPVHDRFREMLDHGELGKPTLRREPDATGETQVVLDIPVKLTGINMGADKGHVLAVDLGVKQQATCTLVTDNDCTDEECDCTDHHGREGKPMFVDHHAKQKLFRVKSDAEGVNGELARLRRDGRDHTEKFDQLLDEYQDTRGKERRLREQIQHDVANQLVWLALLHNCETIVFEDLASLTADKGYGRSSWSIGSWARGQLLDNVEYKSKLLGVDVETVPPHNTSQYCPECGIKGTIVNAPDDHTECNSGGHFVCEACGFEHNRDVVGSLNVGRKYLSDASELEDAKPVVYITSGNHASSQNCSLETVAVMAMHGDWECRSTGVHPAARSSEHEDKKVRGASKNTQSPLDSHLGGTGDGMSKQLVAWARSTPDQNSCTRLRLLASTTECCGK